MNKNSSPKFLSSDESRVIDDLRETIRKGSKVDVAAASFSIYAYQLLKKELEQVEELNFLFTSEKASPSQ